MRRRRQCRGWQRGWRWAVMFLAWAHLWRAAFHHHLGRSQGRCCHWLISSTSSSSQQALHSSRATGSPAQHHMARWGSSSTTTRSSSMVLTLHCTAYMALLHSSLPEALLHRVQLGVCTRPPLAVATGRRQGSAPCMSALDCRLCRPYHPPSYSSASTPAVRASCPGGMEGLQPLSSLWCRHRHREQQHPRGRPRRQHHQQGCQAPALGLQLAASSQAGRPCRLPALLASAWVHQVGMLLGARMLTGSWAAMLGKAGCVHCLDSSPAAVGSNRCIPVQCVPPS